MSVTGDATYKATYKSEPRKYTIKFVNEDGTVLQSVQATYGETPKYTAAAPTKKADTRYTYTFNGWTPKIVSVTGDTTYKATYKSEPRKYTIKFVNEDGTVLQSVQATYGETPKYTAAAPTKKADTRYTYTFNGWTPKIVSVTGDTTYKATYKSEPRKYTIKFVNEDGTVLQSVQVAYGEKPVYTGATPTKAKDSQYTYTFSGWTPAVTAVTGDTTYKATYKAVQNKYTINFVDEDGTVLQSVQTAYGQTPSYTGGTPTKTADSQYTYTFSGWTPAVTTVTGDATYTATYQAVTKKYAIKFVNEDGTVLQSVQVAYGEIPSYTGATPTKTADSQYTYTFSGWTPAVTMVTGDATYTATYQAVTRQYTIKFVNEDGTVLQSSQVTYGEMPAYTGGTPTKIADSQFEYTFSGWTPAVTTVTGDATYTATYQAVQNMYTIRFVNADGTELQSIQVAYGEMPVYPGGTPTMIADSQFEYTFSGWTPAVATVTGDMTYIATYNAVPR